MPPEAVQALVDKLSAQRGIAIDYRVLKGADHFFNDQLEDLSQHINDYLDKALARPIAKPTPRAGPNRARAPGAGGRR